MDNKVLEFKNVGFKYEKEYVLKDVSFSVNKGDFLGIVGENGTGKTTLMRLILGFLHCTEGEILVFGKNAKTFKETEKLGYVSQKANSYAGGFPATVEEVVSASLYAKNGFLKFPEKKDKEAVYDALEQVGMLKNKNRLIGNLSGGEQQRVFIARTLVKKPEILILDEPTVGVDAKSTIMISEIIREINAGGTTVLMTNHDTGALKRDAGKLLILNENGGAEVSGVECNA